MRVLDTIPHAQCQITIFQWNGKYLLKFEQPGLEQTYKISELDVTGPDDVKALLTPAFLDAVLAQFAQMRQHLHRGLAEL